jgi:hypothetical protein
MATSKNVVRIRLEGDGNVITAQSDRIVESLNQMGHMVIEQTRAYPRRAPDQDTSRLYISMIVNGGDKQ